MRAVIRRTSHSAPCLLELQPRGFSLDAQPRKNWNGKERCELGYFRSPVCRSGKTIQGRCGRPVVSRSAERSTPSPWKRGAPPSRSRSTRRTCGRWASRMAVFWPRCLTRPWDVACWTLAPPDNHLVTVQLNINYIRPGWLGEKLSCRSEVRHAGQMTAVARGENPHGPRGPRRGRVGHVHVPARSRRPKTGDGKTRQNGTLEDVLKSRHRRAASAAWRPAIAPNGRITAGRDAKLRGGEEPAHPVEQGPSDDDVLVEIPLRPHQVVHHHARQEQADAGDRGY